MEDRNSNINGRQKEEATDTVQYADQTLMGDQEATVTADRNAEYTGAGQFECAEHQEYENQGQIGYDPNMPPQQYAPQGYPYYGNDPRYNPQYDPNYNPYYGQQGSGDYYQDPCYAQQWGNADPRYVQQYGYPYYGQQGSREYYQDPRYSQQWERPDFERHQGIHSNSEGQERQSTGKQNGRERRMSERYEDHYEERHDRRRPGRPQEYAAYEEENEDVQDDEYFEEDEGGIAGAFGNIRDKLAKIPAKTLLLIGGGIILLLVAIILLVVLLPKNEAGQEVVVATTPTPEYTVTPEPTQEPTPEPTETPHPLATPLEFGMTGDIVADIQQRLIDLGYMDYPVVDGVQQVTTVYGKTTKNAVRTFQSKNGLDTDGNCGRLTYDLLMSDQAKPFYLSRNDEGDDVKKMQEALAQLGYLNASATGYYGESTVQAVQKFQEKNGIEADGKAGQQTLLLLYSGNAVPAGQASSAAQDTPAETAEISASGSDTEAEPAASEEPSAA